MIRFAGSSEWDTALDPHLYIYDSQHSSTREPCWFVAITSFIENLRDMKCDTQAFAHTQARGRPRTRSPLTTQRISPITDFPYAFLNFQLHAIDIRLPFMRQHRCKYRQFNSEWNCAVQNVNAFQLTDDLGTLPLIVTHLLAFSFAIRIRCFGAIVTKYVCERFVWCDLECWCYSCENRTKKNSIRLRFDKLNMKT